jgi:hypothetical protein
MSDNRIYSVKPISFTVGANGSASRIIDTGTFNSLGKWSLQAEVAGGGTFTVNYKVTNMPNKSLLSANTEIIAGAVTAVSNFSEFTPPITRYIQFNVLETGAVGDTITLHIVTQ